MDNPIQTQTQKAYGPIIGIIIVIAIFIAGGVYLFTAGPKKAAVTPTNSEITIIEKDVDASLDNLTADINLSDIDLSMGK